MTESSAGQFVLTETAVTVNTVSQVRMAESPAGQFVVGKCKLTMNKFARFVLE